MFNLVKKVLNTSHQHDLFKKGDKIILAVSGGPDSVCLLDVFSKLQKKYSLELIIVHVNYQLRGKDSDQDEFLVRKLALKYGIKIFVLHPQETRHIASLRPAYKKELSENRLRDIRYVLFEKIRKDNDFDLIAVAHNEDDQAETLLLRLVRGAGLLGLSAMRAKNEKIIRPLLEISRKEIFEYLKKTKIRFRTDKTNLESKFFRNKIRNKLIPYLEKNFNPNIKKTLAASAASIAEDDFFIAEKTPKRSLADFSVSRLLLLPSAIQKRTLRNIIKETKSDLKNISSAHIEELLKTLRSKKNKAQIVMFQRLKIERRGDKLKISKFN